jgi:hypothetical protein
MAGEKFIRPALVKSYDNAIAELFFATLKTELIHKCNFLSRKVSKN